MPPGDIYMYILRLPVTEYLILRKNFSVRPIIQLKLQRKKIESPRDIKFKIRIRFIN